MKPKRKLKEWVKTAVLLLPIEVMIIWQSFFIAGYFNSIKDDIAKIQTTQNKMCIYVHGGWSCYYE